MLKGNYICSNILKKRHFYKELEGWELKVKAHRNTETHLSLQQSKSTERADF